MGEMSRLGCLTECSSRDMWADSLYFLYVVLDSICKTISYFQHILWLSLYVCYVNFDLFLFSFTGATATVKPACALYVVRRATTISGPMTLDFLLPYLSRASNRSVVSSPVSKCHVHVRNPCWKWVCWNSKDNIPGPLLHKVNRNFECPLKRTGTESVHCPETRQAPGFKVSGLHCFPCS
jgi:hypothetical protein